MSDALKIVVSVTDKDWFDTLSALNKQSPLNEVNFWSPSATNFHALKQGELFFFKLHAPHNFIVGGGIFTHSHILPCSLAWEAFGKANGADNAQAMRAHIARYRKADPNDRSDFDIGCRILTQPFFLPESQWVPAPVNWPSNIVTKTYSTSDAEGLKLWEAGYDQLSGQSLPHVADNQPRYGTPRLIQPRLGQGGFRIVVTDLYKRRCAITQERTLPALEAAHIRPYSDGGAHEAKNGLLLRRDIHSLFDAGYVTVTPDFRFEVSACIKEEYENGREYYALHGERIKVPRSVAQRPDPDALVWHNERCFRG